MFCQGEKHISGLAPAPWASCCTPLSFFPCGLADVGHSGCREEVGRGSQAAQRRGSPYSHPNLSLLQEVLLLGAGETRRAEVNWGSGWSLFGLPGSAPSPLVTPYVSLEKPLHSDRHRTTEGPATGAASVEGSSILCMSQQRRAERSYLLRTMYIFQYVSEVHTSKKWHIIAQKLE